MFKRKMIAWMAMIGLFYSCQPSVDTTSNQVSSPDGTLVLTVALSETGNASYSVTKDGTAVLETSQLGVRRQDGEFTAGLKLTASSESKSIKDSYTLKVGKRRDNQYLANQKVFTFANAQDQIMEVIFQLSDDGVAFRYHFLGETGEQKFITDELTTFNLPNDARAWLQPCADAKTGWAQCNPSYEENYLMDISVNQASPTKAGWVYPALFKTGDNWVIISEAGLDKNYCATRLEPKSPEGEYKVGFPQDAEQIFDGELYPESTLPWYSPWRVLAIGSLKTVTESTLGTDVATPAIAGDFSWVEPGRASWSWVLLKDDMTNYPVSKQFIDYASDMGWEYCLIDALWDTQIGYEKIQELVDYAATKDVGLLLWYNSAGNWNETFQTPKDMMLTPESRMAEFKRIKEMGVKGVKIDFFGGDGQSVIEYYHEILTDAAEAGIMVNFHGCTLPRGWQRTYPNLVSMESIKGMEFITFDQKDADVAVPHCAMLPFTRNVFDPMDFTPVAFSEIPNIKRLSSNGFELALSVLFVSGVQHYAETAEGMQAVPEFVREAMRAVPVKWDETVFVDGFPGKQVVMARRSGKNWFIAGINGETEEKALTLDLSFVKGLQGTMINDGMTNRDLVQDQITVAEDGQLPIILKPNGGFLIQLSE
ncbi:Glycosyl-hydrolase 97 C-terminal, oligomerisation [Reichenbachiella agariperforans]|uniref:Glycosyl-hydrolase 97 C-terminal, oligomerisation n=1 Tax=Reichenbachiella agariperforans TaxID=156994 RepID=A0A1M6UXS2_REIAG|nr:glycoside hydrolase family 97 protein [Reichenbachiella agariperforans]SHK73846.1 Glycosyl-hydrolase 97 C-terminal, oligomerisation [Reichenbachiella agariperforans]